MAFMQTYEVFNELTADGGRESHGTFNTLGDARRCIDCNGLQYWAIWSNDELVESNV